uniref:Ribosomal protein S10 n=2 Tax=Roya TaxID=43942 RepID=U5YH07_9VIRI|nr:ribosomal protein S10 [Roya obtusa]AGZ90386.1 ribosomal protein S10 [Roya obtusa]
MKLQISILIKSFEPIYQKLFLEKNNKKESLENFIYSTQETKLKNTAEEFVDNTLSSTFKLPLQKQFMSKNHFIRLPKKKVLYTVLRSPHIDKKSREQFEMITYKQLQIIKTGEKNLRKKLFNLKFHNITGVQMKITLSYKTRFLLKSTI